MQNTQATKNTTNTRKSSRHQQLFLIHQHLTTLHKNNVNKLSIILVAVVALGSGLYFGTQHSGKPDLSQLTGFSFPEPEKLSNVNLVDHNNNPLTEENFSDKWTFIYVGYTFCPDACPMSLNTLNQMDGLLNQQDGPKASSLLVSVDPERDTPEHMKGYVKHFNSGFSGATGTPEAIKQFADQVSAIYSVPEDRSDPNYLVDHSSSIILINPDAAVQAIFTPPQSAEVLAKDFKLLVAHYESR